MFEIKYKRNKLEYLSEEEWEPIRVQTTYKVCSHRDIASLFFTF